MRAFSLIEMMVVVTVIGILVSVAVPRFKTFIARGRQAEAKHNIGVIDKLQQTYNLRWQGFGKDDEWFNGRLGGNGSNSTGCSPALVKNALGFRLKDCEKARYDYHTQKEHDEATNNGNSGLTIYPNCEGNGSVDTWRKCRFAAGTWCNGKIGQLVNTDDIVVVCKD